MSSSKAAVTVALALLFTSAWAHSETEKAAKSSVEGTIVSLRGKTLTIKVKGDGTFPPAGQACTVLKHFKKNLGFLNALGPASCCSDDLPPTVGTGKALQSLPTTGSLRRSS